MIERLNYIERANYEDHNKIKRVLDKLKWVTDGERTGISISALSAILAMISFHKNYKLESIIELIKAQYEIFYEDTEEGSH